MLVGSALARAGDLLPEEVENARQEIIWLLGKLINQDTAWIIAHPDEELDSQVSRQFFDLINQRAAGKPLAYVLNSQSFMGFEFKIDRRALIPRPETEQLVEETIRRIRRANLRDGRFLDLGTGSGVIAICLKKYFPQARVVAVDRSPEALELAEENGALLKVEIEVVESNLFERLRTEKFELIIANLPYVPTEHLAELSSSIRRFEPMKAIDGGERGMDYIRPLLTQAHKHLRPRGLIALEIWPSQVEKIVRLVRDHLPGYSVTIEKDLAGQDRFAFASPNSILNS